VAYDRPVVPPGIELQLRRLILILLACALMALFGELLALGHDEDALQYIPLSVIALTLVVILWHALAGGEMSVRALQVMMVVLLVSGAMGVYLHYQGNVEFQREVNPAIGGWELVKKALHAKAPPALAPGVMAQLGVLGLIYTFRHPALRGSAGQPGA
jgi:hypothetical protein